MGKDNKSYVAPALLPLSLLHFYSARLELTSASTVLCLAPSHIKPLIIRKSKKKVQEEDKTASVSSDARALAWKEFKVSPFSFSLSLFLFRASSVSSPIFFFSLLVLNSLKTFWLNWSVTPKKRTIKNAKLPSNIWSVFFLQLLLFCS
jgi:hypothetical protein